MRRKRGQVEIESWQEWTSIAKVEQGGTTIGLCGGEIPNSNIEPHGRRKWRMKRHKSDGTMHCNGEGREKMKRSKS